MKPKLITAFTMGHHCSTSSHHGSLSFVLILTAHLCLDLPSGLLQFSLPTKACRNISFLSSYCLAHSITHSLTQYYELLYRFHA